MAINETSAGLGSLAKPKSLQQIVDPLAKAAKATQIKSAKATIKPGKIKVKIKGM
jgi:hypothetical protein